MTKRPALPIRRRVRRKLVKPGAYNLWDDFYFSDPLPAPSLSNSVAKVLIEQTPRHAWLEHPRLNPAWHRLHKTDFDFGQAVHDVFMGQRDKLAVAPIDMKDWRGGNADFQHAKRAKGLIPLLHRQMVQVDETVAAMRAQVLAVPELAAGYAKGQPEITLVWFERGIWCRCKLDWLPAVGVIFAEMKTTKRSVNPDTIGDHLFSMQYEIQAAFYMRGIRAVLGIDMPEFRFVFVEVTPPYAVSVIALKPSALDAADADVTYAMDLWRECVTADKWPGYPAQACYVEASQYRQERHLERVALRDHYGGAKGMLQKMMDWQAPL